MGTATYSHLRENLAKIWDRVEDTQEPVIVTRNGHQDLAILPADELSSIQETARLLRSPKNAARLIEALVRAYNREGEETTVEELRARLGVVGEVSRKAAG
jgi:antitoxin YefM